LPDAAQPLTRSHQRGLHMQHIATLYDRIVAIAASRLAEGVALLLARIALAGIFWRSGRSKVTEGSLFEISDSTRYLFENDYAAVPLPAEIAAPLATLGEHLFPVLLVIELATRLSAGRCSQ
ncbi:MAG: DoxX family protein, partial [Sphingobium sp.]|nr:DoxX family protein [Sphingobium sp.]